MDLGGMAKGHAVDLAAEIIVAHGCFGVVDILILGAAVTGYGILVFVLETQTAHFTHIAIGMAMTVLVPMHILIGRHKEKKRMATRHSQD